MVSIASELVPTLDPFGDVVQHLKILGDDERPVVPDGWPEEPPFSLFPGRELLGGFTSSTTELGPVEDMPHANSGLSAS